MSETISPEMSGVSETLLLTLYLRAKESQRPDALIKDERAAALVEKISAERIFDFGRLGSIPLSEENKLVLILRSQECDRYVRDFLGRWPQAMVVHIGCGLDTRFERVDNGQVEWYDLDLPHVIELRRKLIGGEGERYHLLGCSVFEDAWLAALEAQRQRPLLFLAEGVFMYFEDAQVKKLVLTLRDRFPGTELVFDAYSPLHVWRHNLQMAPSKVDLRVHWRIWHGREIEGWGENIRLLDEWGFFDSPTARLDSIRRLRFIESLIRTMRIYHFQLGRAAEPTLSGVPETSLAALYWRAMESQRPDAMIKDEKAVKLVTQMSYDFERVCKIKMLEVHKVMRGMLSRELDRYARDFIHRHPDAVVVHIGCGLDARFERVDNGRVEWYDLDFPDVIVLRRKHLGDERERYHLLACSALDDAWLEAVSGQRQRPFPFLAETVFVYFEEAQVKRLALTLRDHFPGCELVFDAWTPFSVWLGNRWLSPTEIAGLFRWGVWRGQELESWGDGIHLLDEWGFFDQPEPRMARFRWMAPICRLFKIPSSIYHFQLGKTVA